jgi:hypothetical protein
MKHISLAKFITIFNLNIVIVREAQVKDITITISYSIKLTEITGIQIVTDYDVLIRIGVSIYQKISITIINPFHIWQIIVA